MSMIGEYARLTPAELDRAVKDPEWAEEFVQELLDAAEYGAPPGRSRCFSTDKAWCTLDLLLRRAAFPVDAVFGEEEMPGADDWGYGPPRRLTPEQVRTAAAAFAATPGETLPPNVRAVELMADDMYPPLREEEAEAWLWGAVGTYRDLGRFFEAAAHGGDGMLVWLD